MNIQTMREEIVSAFNLEWSEFRPVRAGKVTRAAVAAFVVLALLERMPEVSELDGQPRALSDDQRESVVLQAISFAESMLDRTLGTNLPGYLAISRLVAIMSREWPLI